MHDANHQELRGRDAMQFILSKAINPEKRLH